jgi:MFS family permease
VLGPVISGGITDNWNWHWLFYFNLLPGIVVAILSALLISIDEPDRKLLKDADYPGILLMAIGLGTLELRTAARLRPSLPPKDRVRLLPIQGGAHGFTSRISMPSKSATLRVARTAPRARTVAAITASSTVMGLPGVSRLALISP